MNEAEFLQRYVEDVRIGQIAEQLQTPARKLALQGVVGFIRKRERCRHFSATKKIHRLHS